jgi:KUP system potassium uptake protein
VTATPVANHVKSSVLPVTATVGALGVVYGDIGTSPLYALKEAARAAAHGGALTHDAILGVASLILWALILIISIKYALLIMRADNRGEGGIVALLALLSARNAKPGTWRAQLLLVGLIGAALLYGDGAITPAISVLSAIEGLKVDAPSLTPMVVPLTIAILIGLFMMQKQGTGFIGRIFGPVMLGWFAILAALGIHGIIKAPAVLAGLSPLYAFEFLIHQDFHISFAILGAAFLAVTGGEAMYADMGHFGRNPIRLAWFAIVLPALVLNYFGQAGLLITDPTAVDNPFYQLAPDWMHYPLVAFAALATVIASQAIISGVFSLTQQSIQLGFLPRMRITHTTSDAIGQIYVPLVNWLLAAATLGAVIGFGTSDALAGAYGIAVSLLMAITTLLAALVAIQWGYSPVIVIAVNGFFLVIDCIFFAANSTKLIEGGWFPLLLAGAVAFLMLTWRSGVRLVERARGSLRQPEEDLIETAVSR